MNQLDLSRVKKVCFKKYEQKPDPKRSEQFLQLTTAKKTAKKSFLLVFREKNEILSTRSLRSELS